MRDGVDAAAAAADDNYYTGIKRSLLFACVCFYFLCRTGSRERYSPMRRNKEIKVQRALSTKHCLLRVQEDRQQKKKEAKKRTDKKELMY